MTTAASVGDTLTGYGTLHVTDCPSCGCVYAIPDGIYRTGLKRKSGRTIYCPNGHSWHFTGKTHEEEVRELRDREARAIARRDQAEAAERMARAREAKERKARQRLAARAKAGVCPCCHRTVAQLARHMKTKHPDFEVEGA
jgi:hypothetical protein